jgi:hypothetical protein
MEAKIKARQAEEEIVVTSLRWMRLISCWLLAVSAMALPVEQRGGVQEPGQIKVIQVREPDGQVLSYGDLSRPTEVSLGGTSLAREARLKLRIQGASGPSSLFFIRKRRPNAARPPCCWKWIRLDWCATAAARPVKGGRWNNT